MDSRESESSGIDPLSGSEKKTSTITSRAEKLGLSVTTQHKGPLSIVLLEGEEKVKRPKQFIKLGIYFKIVKGEIGNNCREITERAISAGTADSGMSGAKVDSHVIGQGNHVVAVKTQKGGSLVALDFTAYSYLQTEGANNHVLAITARNQGELQERLGEILGGQWQPGTKLRI